MLNVARDEIATALSQTLGPERAHALVKAAATELGLTARFLTIEQADLILDKLSERPGLEGTVARFCKTRLFLKWSNQLTQPKK